MTKHIILLLISILSITYSVAQDWHTDLESAKELATNEKLPIVLVFQGSDWCAPCIKLNRQVWSTEEFKAYAKNHYVMLQADFPRRKSNALSAEQTTKNKALAEQYNKNGIFPLVVVLDQNGNVLGETSYKKVSPAQYITELNAFIK